MRGVLFLFLLIFLAAWTAPAAPAADDACLRALEQGRPAVAVEECGALLERHQGSPADLAALHHNRGLAYLSLGRLDEALADLDRAVALSPQDGWYLNSRAAARGQRGELDPALVDLLRAVELLPGEPLVRTNLGQLRLARGEREQALAEAKRALELKPDHAPAQSLRGQLEPRSEAGGGAGEAVTLTTRALAHKKAGRFAEATADYRRALAMQPNLVPALNGLAWLLATCREERWRDGKEAVELARRALAQGEDAGRLDTLAAALAEAGELGEAARMQARALSLAGKGSALGGDYLRRLKTYQAGKPWREQP